MKCDCCKKSKGLCITCKHCNNSYCSGCIQLEIHKCDNITVRKPQLVKVVAPKVQKI